MLIATIIAGWWAIGVAGFIYWWRNDHDLKLSDCFFAAIAGVTGPLAWLIGWAVHGHHGDGIVIWRRRAR